VADKKSKPRLLVAEDAIDGPGPEPSLGHLITETRERKGLSREQVVDETHLPAHYVKMIETDSYGMISDRLYLVPFLRRYATFLGLDAEEIASRFVRDVQHAEANVVRISQEITMVTKRSGRAGRIAFIVLIIAVLFLLADFGWRRFVEHEAANPAPAAPAPATATEPNAEAPKETLPPEPIVTNPEAGRQPAAAAAAASSIAAPAMLPPRNPVSGVPRPASIPPAARIPAAPRPVPREATDE
jgi:cytoskeleton protein RodZ